MSTTQTPAPTIPDGYLQNAQGHLVPVDNVRPIDQLRDNVVMELYKEGEQLHEALKAYKAKCFETIEALIQTSAEQYQATLGGTKGNVTLTSYDGRFRIMRSRSTQISFSEEIEAAKILIGNCIDRWSADASDNIKAIVNRAFKTNRDGQLKTDAVLDLLRLEIQDEEWKRAMDALRDSMFANGTATYVRLYQRIETTNRYQLVPLDLASV